MMLKETAKERLLQSIDSKINESILDFRVLQGCLVYATDEELFIYRCYNCDKKEFCHDLFAIQDRFYDEFIKERQRRNNT